jgi:hypothetical protein
MRFQFNIQVQGVIDLAESDDVNTSLPTAQDAQSRMNDILNRVLSSNPDGEIIVTSAVAGIQHSPTIGQYSLADQIKMHRDQQAEARRQQEERPTDFVGDRDPDYDPNKEQVRPNPDAEQPEGVTPIRRN